MPRARRPPRRVELVAVRLGRPGEVWLTRGEGALFGGLWGLPTVERGPGERPVDAAARALGDHGGVALDPAPCGTIEHALTHCRLRVTAFSASAASAASPPAGDRRARFVRLDALAEVGVSALTQKLLALTAARPGPTAAGEAPRRHGGSRTPAGER